MTKFPVPGIPIQNPMAMIRANVCVFFEKYRPDYPSLCAYSMIGESAQFDAIVLEFYVDADDYLIILARRLRRRFPKAAIVLLRIWGPLQFIYLPTDTAQGLRTFLDRHSLSIHDEDFMDVLRTETNQDDWFFNPYSRQLEVQRKVISDVGAILWELERPVDPFEALEQYRAFFAEDLVHISKAGHEMIADRLITVLAQVQKSDETGTWEHDFCQSWFESGNIELQSHEEVVMTEFDTKSHKWALEFNPTVAWMKAQNPLGRTSQVFVRYMKTSPPPGLYPTTMVQIEGGNVGEEVIINPTGSNSFSRSHINQVAKIGNIPPGEMKLVFTALEKGKKFPFRVTGIVIAPFDNELLQS